MAEENEVTASKEQEPVTAEQQIAEKINDVAKTPVEAQGQPEEEKPSESLTPEKIAEMTAKAAADASEKALNSFQGKFANYTANEKREMQEMIDKRLKPVLDLTDKIEQAQVEQLEPEQQVEYYKRKAEEASQVPESPQVQQEQKPTPQQEVLADTTRQMISENNLNMSEFDERVWKGWNQNMNTAQLIKLAQTNIEGLVTPKQTQTPAQQEPVSQNQPPPSTSSAPKAGSNRVSTISDLSELMANGQIDATQYRAAREEIRLKGFSNL